MIVPSPNTRIEDFAQSLMTDYQYNSIIPQEVNENNWKWWGNIVASSPIFAIKGCPTTENFSSWQEWGIIMYNTMAK